MKADKTTTHGERDWLALWVAAWEANVLRNEARPEDEEQCTARAAFLLGELVARLARIELTSTEGWDNPELWQLIEAAKATKLIPTGIEGQKQ